MVSTRGSRYKFSEGERVLCYEPDPTKAKVLYDSKVLEVTEGKDKRGRRCVEYLIHFQGWNSSWDRAVSEDFVLKDTEENRQLQRDLAEQSQLQIGAYLYRRERKKRSGGSACTTGGSSTGDSSSGAKRARHVDDDADASSGDSTPHHHQGDTETGETVDTDSSSSSQQSVAGTPLIRPIAHPPMIQTNGRTAIVLPTGVRERLTYDYHLVVKRGRLSYLPASPNVCTILESCVREYARIGVWRSPKPAARRGRMSPVQDVRPDINDVSRRLNLMREVAEGIRVYFDFLLNRHLLYRQETEQYHTLVGCFIEKSTAKEEELLQTMAANIVAASEASSSNTWDSSQGPGALHKEAPHTNNTTTHTHSTQPSTSAGLRSHYRIAPKQQLRSKFVRVIPVMRITRQQTDNNNTYAADHRSPAVRFKIERPLDGGKPTSVRYKLRSPKRDRSMEEANVRTGRSESSIVQQMNNQVHYWANGIGEDAEIVENWIERGKPDTDEDETGEATNNDNFAHNDVGKENTAGKVGNKAAQEVSLGEWVNGEEGESQYGTTGTDIEDEESGSEETETEEDNEEGLDLTVNALDQDDVELVDSDEDWGAGVDMEAEEEAKPIKMEAKFEAQENKVQKNGEKKQDSNIKKQEEPDTKYIKKEKNNVKAEPYDEIGEEKESIEKIKDTLEVEKDIEIKHRALSPRGKVSGGKDMDKVLKEAAPGTSAGVPDSLARRLRSHKSSVNSTEPCDEKPSTSTGILNSEIPLLKGSSLDSTCSSERCGGSGKPWVRGGLRHEPAASRGVSGPEPAVTHGGPMDPTMARGPVAKLLEKISSWELLPSVGHEHVPSKVYGAVHLSRLFVRLPDFLNAINIPEAKLKLLLSYISVFVHYLEEHKEFFGDTYYKPDAYSSRSQM